ncbi:MAG: sigma-70 family RNA polymerase sigma factor [Raineya sp.]|jgi:RNA polymerase sigma-70 factor (ECF subfamily)|nr:sigma-70 family RNA polymerase sigma factor [Raineya sp.]
MNKQNTIEHMTSHLFRENSGKMVAVLSKKFGLSHLETILDIVQDTFETALNKWRFSGLPDNPSAWLMTVAKNKALNAIQKQSKNTSDTKIKAHYQTVEQNTDITLSEQEISDSQLHLLLACLHTEFSQKNQIILTLYVLCGFGVPEISSALCMTDEAVKKVLTRSKAILRESDNIFNVQLKTKIEFNIQTIHAVLYLMFNEGYKTTRNQAGINRDVCFEAMRLTKLLLDNHYSNHETQALMSLMFFHVSRFSSRIENNEWLILEEQDRSQWNKIFIEEGYFYLNLATHSTVISRFHLEALINSLHCIAPNFEQTDWQKIVFLYQELEKLEKTPYITLNRIIAESHVSMDNHLIEELEVLENSIPQEHLCVFLVTKAELHKKQGNLSKMQDFLLDALKYCKSEIDRRLIEKKLKYS